jgi:DNA repair photolyase
MTHNLILDNKSGTEPFLQQKIESGYDFPFTMNPTIGCFYGCHYCFSPIILQRSQKEFFSTVKVKGNFPDKINKKLHQLKYLPQHFKRVQINESADYYHPGVFHGMEKEFKRDLLREIYKVFENHWLCNNKWMLHILTKSHLITEHLEILKSMKEMVQIEISICSPDETVIRKYEKETPSLKRRLETIEKLSKAGVFVRVMAMPFLGTKADAVKLKDLCFNSGAQGFKHKSMNYFAQEDLEKQTWADVLTGKLQPTLGRNDEIWEELTVKSGEFVPENSDFKRVDVLWSDKKNWAQLNALDANFQVKKVRLVDCGYAGLNSVDWGYVV